MPFHARSKGGAVVDGDAQERQADVTLTPDSPVQRFVASSYVKPPS